MADKSQGHTGYDYFLLIPTLLLLGLGLVVIYSASSLLAAHRLGDSYFFLKKQGMFCLMGLCLLILAKNIPTTVYRKITYPLLLVNFALLVLLFIPGVGVKVGGACRWLRFAGFSFQPSELAKLSLAIYIAYSMTKKNSSMALFSNGLLPHLFVAGTFIILIILQPDLGTSVILGCWLLIHRYLANLAGRLSVEEVVGFY